MNTYSLSHLSDQTLLRGLTALVARDRSTTAQLLAHLAEVDEQRLYLPAAYPSMYAWCVGELGLCEQAAYKRIQAARAARRFPVIFQAIADGRVHLSAVLLLAAHLTEDNAGELLAAAAHTSKAGIEQMLAERFPRPDLLAWITAIPESSGGGSAGQLAPQVTDDTRLVPERVGAPPSLAPGAIGAQLSPGIVAAASAGDRSKLKPLSPQRFGVQFTMGRSGHDKLRQAQALLGHQVASGDVAQVFERALETLIEKLGRQKFAATSAPRPGHRVRDPAPLPGAQSVHRRARVRQRVHAAQADRGRATPRRRGAPGDAEHRRAQHDWRQAPRAPRDGGR